MCVDEIRVYAPRGSRPRCTLSVRVTEADLKRFRADAVEAKVTLAAFSRLTLAAGRRCLGRECDWHDKAVANGEALAAALARIDELEQARLVVNAPRRPGPDQETPW